jgi:hypothetical protein
MQTCHMLTAQPSPYVMLALTELYGKKVQSVQYKMGLNMIKVQFRYYTTKLKKMRYENTKESIREIVFQKAIMHPHHFPLKIEFGMKLFLFKKQKNIIFIKNEKCLKLPTMVRYFKQNLCSISFIFSHERMALVQFFAYFEYNQSGSAILKKNTNLSQNCKAVDGPLFVLQTN